MAARAQDAFAVTVPNNEVRVREDAFGQGGSLAPALSNQVPVPGAINQLPTVVIAVEAD